jgi:hypothetical protein
MAGVSWEKKRERKLFDTWLVETGLNMASKFNFIHHCWIITLHNLLSVPHGLGAKSTTFAFL